MLEDIDVPPVEAASSPSGHAGPDAVIIDLTGHDEVVDVTDAATGALLSAVPSPREPMPDAGITVVTAEPPLEVVLPAQREPAPAPLPVVDGRLAVTIPPIVSESPAYRAAKRAFDLLVAVPLFVLTLPVMVVVAVLIRLDSKGPAIFRHERVGLDGRLFRFYKFRTMYADARTRFPEMYAYRYSPDEVATLHFKLADDPRLTRFGAKLRRTSIDELPNLINVIRGDMSLVGPRPDIPEMVAYYSERQLTKLAVKPGLTGLSQTSGRNILTFQETLHYDVLYVERRSFWFDLLLTLRTIATVALQFGAL